ncbi:MGMT family protein [Enterococcus sp. LJL51]|uniref:MGMT family protein n=1 Tax=Enterococcus sp. LJL51 TaxID=3416656 RepID=UPI003CEFD392
MANEDKKDFNAMLNDPKDMPKTKVITDQKTIDKYGGSLMYFAPPLVYDKLMKQIPKGKVITVTALRDYLAKINHADFTEPITAGAFTSIAAWASSQRETDLTPYWRTLKAHGEINPKFPGGVDFQKERLEQEGHQIIQRGRKNIRYYVKDFETVLFDFV